MTKVLITGGAGFIGSNFVFHMLDKYPEYKDQIVVGTFHDEDIYAAFRELGPGNDGLVVKLHISGVKDCCAGDGFQLHPAGAQNVPGIM
mgnify:CR=1 FL=1